MSTLITQIKILKHFSKDVVQFSWNNNENIREEHEQKIRLLIDDVPQELFEAISQLKEDVIDLCLPFLTAERRADFEGQMDIKGVSISHQEGLSDNDGDPYFGAVISCQSETKANSPWCYNTPHLTTREMDVNNGYGMSVKMREHIAELLSVAENIVIHGERNTENKLI
jgi:hypothetical protein